MKIFHIIIVIVFIFIPNLKAQEYMYPVAAYDSTILLAYQKSLHTIQLWSYNIQTGAIDEVLGGLYTPLAVSMLPDNSGFSFIDHGRIRIKHFNERSPKAIDLYKPISNITLLHWIDSRRCFFSGRYKNRYQVFQMTIDGYVTPVVAQKYADCLFPQKIDDRLFYIERLKHKNCSSYRIMQTGYFQSIHKKPILYFGELTIGFLTMLSDSLGYVLEYPSDVPDDYTTITLTCHRLERVGQSWTRRRLFTFKVPLSVLEGNQQLAESLLPLLPHYYHDGIDFVHYDENALNLFRFHFGSKKSSIEQLTFGRHGQHFIAPQRINNTTFYGESLLSTLSMPCKRRVNHIIDKKHGI